MFQLDVPKKSHDLCDPTIPECFCETSFSHGLVEFWGLFEGLKKTDILLIDLSALTSSRQIQDKWRIVTLGSEPNSLVDKMLLSEFEIGAKRLKMIAKRIWGPVGRFYFDSNGSWLNLIVLLLTKMWQISKENMTTILAAFSRSHDSTPLFRKI